jgi:ATP-binding cassette subfamily C protein
MIFIFPLLSAIPLYERTRPILEATPETDGSKAWVTELGGNLEISEVSFQYQPDGPMVLKNVSLHATPGEFIALVGPSGSGKSTIFRLILGFETPGSGSVYFDRRDLRGLSIQSVRKRIGVVLQTGRLLPGSVYENIVGATQLTLKDAWIAARMAALDKDIEQMPMGMQTFIGEGGSGLSGGQRQRLLIARALVRRPRILLFDEATSALDNESQSVVSESLESLQATRIVIAHRLSTVKNADRIYALEGGEVTESGAYEELIAKGGAFARLAQRQII